MPTYTIKIQAADKITVQDTGEHLLSVLFDIVTPELDAEGKEVVDTEGKTQFTVVQTARHGFPLDTPPETVQAELREVLSTYVTDADNTARNAEFAAKDAQADATIADIVGKEISN